MGFNQGELVAGHTRILFCSGQTAMSADGNPQHEGDMAAQAALALDNLEAVLAEAGMTLTDVVRFIVHHRRRPAFRALRHPRCLARCSAGGALDDHARG